MGEYRFFETGKNNILRKAKMMTTPYHSNMTKYIRTFGSERQDKYIFAHNGNSAPMFLNHPQTKKKKIPPIEYKPDVYFVTKRKSHIVFEVLDSEMDKVSEIISDIIQCCIASNVTYLIFVIPLFSDDKVNRIFDTFDVLTDTLKQFGLNKNWVPKLAIYSISRSESRSFKKVEKILSRLSKKDKW